MTDFEEEFLLCKLAGFSETDLFFCSGPNQILEPFTSVMVGVIEEYQTTAMAVAISCLPGTVSLREHEFENVWRWERSNRFIEISVNDDNTFEGGWLGSPLKLNCTFSDLVEFWLNLARSYPAIYVHQPSCRMYTPCSFLEEVAMRELSRAFRSGDSGIRERAMQEFQRYRTLHGQPRRWRPSWEEKAPHAVKTLFDLAPPVVPIQCKDFWQVDNWFSRIDQFDHLAHARQLAYFAYPTLEIVGKQHKYGFMVWVSEEKENLGREIADSLGVLVEGMVC